MTEVVSIKFKSSGKSYYFSPEGMVLRDGDRVIVETAKGLEIAEKKEQVYKEHRDYKGATKCQEK